MSDFAPGEVILGQLDFAKVDGAIEVNIDSAYGLAGTIRAGSLRLEFEPEKP